MDAAMASTTRITVAEIPCPGALASRSDAAQCFSSGGLHLVYIYRDFAAPRVSHSAKWGSIFRSNFRDRPICAEKKSGPEIGHLFFRIHPVVFEMPPSGFEPKATAFWRWSNYLQACSTPGRPLVMNMDETNVKLVPHERAGHATKRAYRLFVQRRPMSRNASLSAQRSTITHVAAMCDRSDFKLFCHRSS